MATELTALVPIGSLSVKGCVPKSDRRPGFNIDQIDTAAGIAFACKLGYESWAEQLEIEYNLVRWGRGEENEADHSMANSLSGVSYTDWRAVLAHAIAAAQQQPSKTDDTDRNAQR